ncbi:discoidin domain-containing receptor 2-like isoform X1 [Colletes latitarsis]|uniref:discoidin domain-containing receptor 2-like isoform X1 n=2 Tax=Colletes latitarsis TaxID=2605962 RepID=UPI0040367B37
MPGPDIKMRRTLTIVSLVVFFAAASSPVEDSTRNVFDQCILPLGMEEGKIPDDAITASSSYETKSVGPQNARIRQEKNGGAWCPKAQISSAIREYLEIDLTRNHLIAWTETQGRFGNGQGQEYAEAFFLEYWRDARWHQYKNLRGDRVLRGNSNTYLVEKQKLDLPFVASRVRFVPYSQHPRTVCMRVEIYGCVWEQYVARYAAPKGSTPGPKGCNVEDSSYDGTELDAILVNGLGQLTDGILGEVSEILTASTTSTNWVGWSHRDVVQLIFEFQELREFENCSIHVARSLELEVETFSTLRIWFSTDGENYQANPEIFETMLIDASPTINEAILTSIALQSRIGKFVKLELSLASKWLLLSEITFHTVSCIKNRSTDSYSSIDGSFRADRNQSELQPRSPNSEGTIPGFNETEIYETKEDVLTPDAFPVGTSQTYVGLVSGLLTVLVLFLTCTIFLIKQRGRNKVALLQKHTALLCDSSAPGIAISPKDVKLPNSIVNGLSLVRKPITIATVVSATNLAANNVPDQFDRTRTNSRGTADSDRRPSTVYERTYKLFSDENFVHAEPNASACTTNSCTDFKCLPGLAKDKSTELRSKKVHHYQSAKTTQKVHEGYYAATDILTIKRRVLPSTVSPFTSLYIREKGVRLPRTLDPYDVQRISKHRLRILDKLGEGNFGLVHLCEAKGITNPELGSIQNRQTVIVRSLWRGVVDSLRLDFTKDMLVLAALRDPNLTKMIALVEEEPFGAVFEYGQHGDLPTFLESREKSGNEDTFSYGDRLNFITQVASGMKYLESMNIPHCDLAARNCIVDQNLTIKISDHAMYCSKYDHHYYIDGCNAKIPLRWMAWEAVLLSKRSCQADVWSFAVTVWEVFMNCKEIPYPELTAEQVLENCGRWYQSETCVVNGTGANDERNRPRILARPNRCSDDLYRMMNKCWSKRTEDRPTFEEIYLYLERLALD